MKSIVLLAFKTYTQGVLFNFTDKVIQNMNSDAQFTSLKPQVDEMSLRFAEYKTIANDVNALGPLSTRAKADKKETFMHQLTIVARRVDELADGNESVLLAAGFEVRTAAKAIDSVEPPTNFTVEKSLRPNAVEVSWTHAEGRHNYALERRIEGAELWQNGNYPTGKKITLTNLESGAIMEFRIRTVGRRDLLSDWTQPVSIRIS